MKTSCFYILTAAISAFIFSSCRAAEPSQGNAMPTNSPTAEWVLLSYSPKSAPNGIDLYRLDLPTGKLSFVQHAIDAPDPNFLALSADSKFLYASTDETVPAPKGSVTAFSFDIATGKIAKLNHQPSDGLRAVHVSIDPAGKTLLVANYQGSTVASFPIQPNGEIGPAASVQKHEGTGPNAKRQDHPYPHSIYPDPAGKFVLSCDLGVDKIYSYKLDPATSKLTPNDPPSISVAPGAGPRHLAFSKDGRFVYLITEMGNTLITFSYDATNGSLKELQTVSTLPRPATDADTGAEIFLHPNGKFLYCSNRGHDSIATFSIDQTTGLLTLVGHQSVLGKGPRNFGIDPTGQYLMAGNQNSNNAVLFKIDPATGKPTPTDTNIKVQAPMCILFIPIPN